MIYNNDNSIPTIQTRTERMNIINKLRKQKAAIDNALTKALNSCGHLCVDLGGDPKEAYKCIYCGKTLDSNLISPSMPSVDATSYFPNESTSFRIKRLQTMVNEILVMNGELSDNEVAESMQFLINDLNKYRRRNL